jgi:adenylate cyclase
MTAGQGFDNRVRRVRILPIMAAQQTHGQLTPLTVLFADITGSTTLYAQRGDATAFALASQCLDLAGERIAAGGGRVMKKLGDGILAVFQTPVEAVQAAAQIRQGLDDPDCTLASQGVRLRVGISCGPAVLVPDDVYGDVVNVAARLTALAGADEIFLSGKVYEALPPALRAKIRLIDQILLRNRPAPVLVYEYAREESEATVSVPVRRRASTATMELTHGDLLLVVGPERPRVTIGRHAENDIRVEHDVVSRNHAEIALRGDRFVLVDRSTNGTYVYVDNGPMLRVVREEIVLSGIGRIVIGTDGGLPIHFRVAAL